MPNVAEVACIHCRPAQPLPKVSIFFFLMIYYVMYNLKSKVLEILSIETELNGIEIKDF